MSDNVIYGIQEQQFQYINNKRNYLITYYYTGIKKLTYEKCNIQTSHYTHNHQL
jgi:hypothetical protein